MGVARFLVDRGANPFYNGDDLVEIARLRRLADMESCKKFDEGWRSLHEGLLPKEVFELLGKMAPPEIRSDSDSKWDQEGYEFAFAKGKLKSWSKPAPYVFKVNK